jgi:D-glycero-D-manno-heptose 1,7-bisphosphate phosphatase
MPAPTETTASPAVFLDRDGTLNHDLGYTHLYSEWSWVPGALESLRVFHRLGLKIVVISNQSGIARGFFQEEDVAELHRQVSAELTERGLRVDAFYYCPHHPDFTGPCDCRKPAPGLFFKAAAELRLDLPRSFVVGDNIWDAEAGVNAGLRENFLIVSPSDPPLASVPPNVTVVRDLWEAANLIRARPSAL